MTDPISDMLTRIRNAQAVEHQTVSIPFSKLKFNLAKILEKEGFIQEVSIQGRKTKKIIEIKLKYELRCTKAEGLVRKEQGRPAISGLKRISKPSQRIYLGKDEIRPVKQGYGLTIISTPQGLMTDKEARQKRIGGEVICEVW